MTSRTLTAADFTAEQIARIKQHAQRVQEAQHALSMARDASDSAMHDLAAVMADCVERYDVVDLPDLGARLQLLQTIAGTWVKFHPLAVR